MRRLMRGGLLLLTAGFLALTVVGCAKEAGADEDNRPTIAIHYSKFEPANLTVRAGEPITFVLRNDDPIEHEWIIGSGDVHERHRTGTEPYHDQVPTEVTIPAYTTRTTTLTFEASGTLTYICHLPGHEEYGMRGTLTIVGPGT